MCDAGRGRHGLEIRSRGRLSGKLSGMRCSGCALMQVLFVRVGGAVLGASGTVLEGEGVMVLRGKRAVCVLCSTVGREASWGCCTGRDGACWRRGNHCSSVGPAMGDMRQIGTYRKVEVQVMARRQEGPRPGRHRRGAGALRQQFCAGLC
jgi:hypothetical protein